MIVYEFIGTYTFDVLVEARVIHTDTQWVEFYGKSRAWRKSPIEGGKYKVTIEKVDDAQCVNENT